MSTLPQTPTPNAQVLRDAFEFRVERLVKMAKLPREKAQVEAMRQIVRIAKNRGFTQETLREAAGTLGDWSDPVPLPEFALSPGGSVVRQGEFFEPYVPRLRTAA